MPFVMHYAPSGRFKSGAILALPLGISLWSSLLAIAYVLGVWYCPVTALRGIAPLLWGIAVGLMAVILIKKFHVRNPGLALVLVLAGVTVGYAFSWVLWADFVLNMSDEVLFKRGRKSIEVLKTSRNWGQVIHLLQNPGQVLEIISETYKNGWLSFGLGQAKESGWTLALIWLAEGLFYYTVAVIPALAPTLRPYSESSGHWLEPVTLPGRIELPPASYFIIDPLKNGDLNFFSYASKSNNSQGPGLELTIYGLNNDLDNWAFLTVDYHKPGKNGKVKKETIIFFMAVPQSTAKFLASKFS